jgi:FkbM family methyltransferase
LSNVKIKTAKDRGFKLNSTFMLGQLLLRYRQRREQARYCKWLANGKDVWEQNAIADGGPDRKIISNLQFKKGVNFQIKDGLSAAHTFREIFLHRDYDIPMLREAKQIVDVGANIGLFSYYAMLRSNGFVHAFEADPDVYQLLAQNLGAACPERCRINHAAVSSRSRPLTFYVSPVSGWSSLYPVLGARGGRKVKVQGIRLTDYLNSSGVTRVDVLKIDVEGAEYEVLLEDDGLRSFDIGSIVMEVDKNPREGIQHTFAEMIDFLRNKFSYVAKKKGGPFPIYHCWNSSVLDTKNRKVNRNTTVLLSGVNPFVAN